MALEWIPESFPKSGGLAASGFSKLLGRPKLDPLTVLLRETAQNSWDARLSDDLSVNFTVEGWDLDSDEITALRDSVFTDVREARGIELAAALRRQPVRALYIYDRNTRGLGGPLSADEHVADGVYNWVDFVLNAGKGNEDGGTGGTYGFGKTIAYVVSRVSTVVIHSRTIYKGRPQSRLIACAIGTQFDKRSRLYTGRHWWGVRVDEGPHPLTGPAADRLALDIGMPEFQQGETGTNLLILDPELNGRTPAQAMTFLAEAAAWNLWPKRVPRGAYTPMEISVTWNGEATPIPDPVDRPPLDGFVRAFEGILAEGTQPLPPGGRIESISVQRPKTIAGDLATVPLVYRPRPIVDDGSDPADPDAPVPAMPIRDRCHHVALLRQPELVIDYLEGPLLPDSTLEWAGVFRCCSGNDRLFAQAEPPTHDRWNPELMPKGPERTIVNVTLGEIRRALDDRWAQRPSGPAGPVSGTAYIADMLGKLVGSVEGSGKGRPAGRTTTGSASSPRQPRLEIVAAGPAEMADSIGTVATVRITPPPGSNGVRLKVGVSAALDGTTGSDDIDPDLQLLEARFGPETVAMKGTTGELRIGTGDPTELMILVGRGPATTVLFDLEAELMETE